MTDKRLKNIPAKKPQIEGNYNHANPTKRPGISHASAAIFQEEKTRTNSIRSVKKSAKNFILEMIKRLSDVWIFISYC